MFALKFPDARQGSRCTMRFFFMNNRTALKKSPTILAEPALSGLYAITDPHLMSGDILFSKVEAALRGGCRLLQYRHKQASDKQKKAEAQQLRELCWRYQASFMVNDDVDLALAMQADGVHIGQTDTSLKDVRGRVGERMLVGVSCHNSLELAQQAAQEGASYVAFGRFFASHTKPLAPAAELEILRRARQQLQIPLVAIGGITRDNAPRVIQQGANMIAVIHDLFSAEDPAEIETRARFFTTLFT